mmetsp:Transcript_4140/g.26161  ORF Transcript_4140/g.26161 Transcript_4140/m.26161 type:complete len:300 (+) Transcript_4140:1568-2467(+)
MTDHIESSLFIHKSCHILAIALEGRHDVQRFPGPTLARLDGATVHHQCWTIEPSHCNNCPWHVFIASWKRHVCIVPLGSHHRLNAVGDDFSRLQGIAHPRCTHGDAVAHTNRIEAIAHQPCFFHAFLHFFGQVHEMHVARIAFIPHRRDAHLGFVQIFWLQSRRIQHRLARALRLGLRDVRAVLVQLRLRRRLRRVRRAGMRLARLAHRHPAKAAHRVRQLDTPRTHRLKRERSQLSFPFDRPFVGRFGSNASVRSGVVMKKERDQASAKTHPSALQAWWLDHKNNNQLELFPPKKTPG